MTRVLVTGGRLGELQHVALDSSALTAATGWTPRVDLEDGLIGTVAWISGTIGE